MQIRFRGVALLLFVLSVFLFVIMNGSGYLLS